MRPAIIAATLTAAALGAITLVHFAQAQARNSMDPVCTPSGLRLDQTLTRTRLQLTRGRTLTIVAIGSIVEMIAAEASAQGVATFRRFALMKDWRENQRIPFEAFSIEDGFHMNDWGYDCFARNLSAAIIDAAMPTVVASVRTDK